MKHTSNRYHYLQLLDSLIDNQTRAYWFWHKYWKGLRNDNCWNFEKKKKSKRSVNRMEKTWYSLKFWKNMKFKWNLNRIKNKINDIYTSTTQNIIIKIRWKIWIWCRCHQCHPWKLVVIMEIVWWIWWYHHHFQFSDCNARWPEQKSGSCDDWWPPVVMSDDWWYQ